MTGAEIKPEEAPDTVSLEDVKAANKRLSGVITVTPILTSDRLNALVTEKVWEANPADEHFDVSVYFKCEMFQKTGSFKYRGASNAIAELSQEQRDKGVVTHSSGNFAAALAAASTDAKVKNTIVMPKSVPSIKKINTEQNGGNVVLCEDNLKAREDTANELVAKTGGVLCHPFDQESVVAGQGTCGLEILEQVKDVGAAIIPVGGGGLISGISIALKKTNPSIAVYGAEPEGANDAYQSFVAKKWIPQTNPQTIADGLRTSTGTITLPIILKYVDNIYTVKESDIVTAMREIWKNLKVTVEPSGAVPFAALLFNELLHSDIIRNKITKIVVVLSGGNIDFENFNWKQ